MRLITDKKKIEIGKRLAAIMYIAIHGYGKGMVNDLDATARIIDHVYEIAYMVGGFGFSSYEIPKWFDNLKRCSHGERKGGAE